MADPIYDQIIGTLRITTDVWEGVVGTLDIYPVRGVFSLRISAVDSDMYDKIEEFGIRESLES